jgi:Leucine-rich repeat (LRR) protein
VARLRDLDVASNPLGELPVSLTALVQLRSLSCAGCKLSSFPSLAPLRSLRSLDLGHNAFTKVPRSLSELVALETLGRMSNVYCVGVTMLLQTFATTSLSRLTSPFPRYIT